MNTITVFVLFLTIGLTIFMVLYNPKEEKYLTLAQMGHQYHIKGLVDSSYIPRPSDQERVTEYDRHGYDKYKRRYNFLNKKNTLYNE